MIVRINQIDLARIDADNGWPSGSYASSIVGGWPADARAFELLILSQDEKQQPLTDDFRQHQLRQMIPQAAIALSSGDGLTAPADTSTIVRLDGNYADHELAPAWHHLIDPKGAGAFAFSPTMRSDANALQAWGSARIDASWRRLAQVCGDPAIGLERSVRLRLFSVPHPSAPTLLELSATDDSRWSATLVDCQFYLSTTPELKGLHLVVRRLEATQVKSRVMQRLMAVARGEPAIPE